MNVHNSTKHRFDNSHEANLWISWKREDPKGGHRPDGWYGDCTFWLDGNTKYEGREHSVEIGQGSPIGSIHFALDTCNYGAAAFSSIPGTGITERDLLWAGEWALEAIKRTDEKLVEAVYAHVPLMCPKCKFLCLHGKCGMCGWSPDA